MIISYKWLQEFLKISLTAEQLKEKLTFSGIEVESTTTSGDFLKQFIVAKVTFCQKHPDSDHLSITEVFDGKETHKVVCGAHNVAEGQTIAYAHVGTDFGDFKLKKAKIRGAESAGMICSERELQLSDEHEGILVLPSDAPIGTNLADFYQIADTVYEVEITPNRPDLLGMLGIARDLSAQLNIPLQKHPLYPVENNLSMPTADDFRVVIAEPDLCSRYYAVRMSNIKIAPSPIWLKDKLKIADIKPINNVVDITNYIMYVLGHPLHAFDERCIDGRQIIVRKSMPNESFPALDHQTYNLTGAELVIADTQKPVALAGVIGGLNSHIQDSTTDIVIEAACFDSSITRRTSHNLKIFTDSSYRFERGMAEQTCVDIAINAAKLVAELAGGKVVQVIDVYPGKKPLRVVKLRPVRVKKLLSLNIDNHKMINYLQNLGCKFLGANEEELSFEVPANRKDLTREIDLIEEILRLHGFDKVDKPVAAPQMMNSDIFYARRKIKQYLVHQGFQEAVNITFTDQTNLDMLNLLAVDHRRQTVRIINPQGESFSVLRSTLIPQLLKNVALNLNHSNENVKLFEMNKVFTRREEKLPFERWRLTGVLTGKSKPIDWSEKSGNICYHDVKGIVEGLLDIFEVEINKLNLTTEPFYIQNGGANLFVKSQYVGSIGKLDQRVLSKFDIPNEVLLFDLDLDALFTYADFSQKEYTHISKYPIVSRDLSFVVSEEFTLFDIVKWIKETNPKTIKSVIPFDEFKGKQIAEGSRSLSINISLNSESKTLTDEQIKSIMQRIIDRLKEKFKIEMR
ncbi:MAG: phenylalanine--tRNA ligase subunit beta [Candidatus Cloacimonetes bacterium]|nr:phenylalanine--tRNA ligase subunit beta [Candidatus Cloacimonadota bacterium]